jgi:hypothetical protein
MVLVVRLLVGIPTVERVITRLIHRCLFEGSLCQLGVVNRVTPLGPHPDPVLARWSASS